MAEDTALILKKAHDRGKQISIEAAKEMLVKSELIGKLLIKPKQRF